MKNISGVLFKEIQNKWCEVKCNIKDGELTFSGVVGIIITEEEAEKMAKDYWTSFFEEDLGYITEMNNRCGCNCKTIKSAVNYVLKTDGKLHGLDVFKEENGKIYLIDCCGLIREEIYSFFPELKILEYWHLNKMHAECEHQEKLGWTYNTHKGQKCPVCDYKIGASWTSRELPIDIINFVKRYFNVY